MSHKMRRVILSLVVMVSFLGLDYLPGKTASSKTYTTATLAPVWRTGILSDGVGPANIIVEDLNQDGKTDLATCSRGYVYVLNFTPSGAYNTIWFSEYIGCSKIAAADRDSDGVHELYVATEDGKVRVFNGNDFQPLGSLDLPSGTPANDIEIAEVDSDGFVEIVIPRTDATLVYDANTFILEWQAIGLGGNKVEVGNIDIDLLPEIIVNGSPAHILDASQKVQKWAYSGGFGSDMGIGDVDGDGRAEIAWIASWDDAFVLEGDTLSFKWQRSDLSDINAIKVFDVDNDNLSEVIIGDGQWGEVTGYNGVDGTRLWSIPNPEHGVFGIGVGDANNNGVNEVIWGAGLSSSGKDALYVGSWVSQTVEWSSPDLDGPLYAAVGDLDQDGQNEIVMATGSTTSGYAGGTICVYDGLTHQLEWSTVISGSYFNIYQLLVAQLDTDPALEILVGGDNWYDTRLKSYDGISHAVEWTSPDLGGGAPSALSAKDLDNDGIDEVVIGLSDNCVQIYNGASNIIEWDSGIQNSSILDLSLGDLDGNGIQDVAVLSTSSVSIYEYGTWSQKVNRAFGNGNQLAIANADLQGPGELLLVYDSGSKLEAWNGSTYTSLWQRPLGVTDIKDLVVGDIDADASQEFILVGGTGSGFSQSSLLWVGSPGNPFFWEYKEHGNWGIINSFAFANLDNDTDLESVFGSSNLIQQYDILPITKALYQHYLSYISKPRPPRGLYGTVKENGVPAASVPLDVRFFNGSSWSTITSANTAADGSFAFSNLPSLGAGQAYYVRFQNSSSGSPDRLWTWHTRLVESFTTGGEIHIGDFDIANLVLASPYDGETIWLPYTFQWIPRYTSPTDSYEFNLYDAYDGDPWFYTDPPLGFNAGFNLKSLPPPFETNYPYLWEVWIYSPDGGYGISFDTHLVYFSYTGLTFSAQAQPFQPKPNRDLENHSQK